MVKKSEFSRFRQVSLMKFFARLFILIGLAGILFSLFQLLINYTQNDWANLTEYLSYIFLESDERFVLIIGLFIFIIGRVMFNKVKKRGRIFY